MRHAPTSLPVLVLFTALASTALPARAINSCPARDTWPAAEWADASADVAGAKAAQIKALEDYMFTLVGKDEDRVGIRTDGVVIIKSGKLVYEKYARGFTAGMRHPSWSVSKSVTNALAAVAVQRIGFDVEKSICDFLPGLRPESCAITPRNLLEFASGLNWKESYEGEPYQVSSVLAMLYGVGRKDSGAFVASHELRDPPGTSYMYSTGDATLLAAVVNAAFRKSMDENYAWTTLFDPLGMKTPTFERDATGAPVGGSYWYATPRDMARFGYLLLNDGCWSGARILPERWVWWSSQVSEPYRLRALEIDPGDVQGRQFWLNRAVPEQGMAQPWPDVPADAYAARGHWGQSITVVPSEDVVIVRTGDDRDTGITDFNKFLSLALAVVK
jgi:CubicO group peptidase (beta-lactamase class C family)